MTHIYVRTRFIGFHSWPDAPDSHKYLANVHRHEFHVEMGIKVTGLNRELEFHKIQTELKEYIDYVYTDKETKVELIESCETIAQQLLTYFSSKYKYPVLYVDVSEDGENGARVTA